MEEGKKDGRRMKRKKGEREKRREERKEATEVYEKRVGWRFNGKWGGKEKVN